MATPSTDMEGALATVQKALGVKQQRPKEVVEDPKRCMWLGSRLPSGHVITREATRVAFCTREDEVAVTVKLPAKVLPVARAIALSMTEHNDPDEPAFTLLEVLEHMMLEGLIAREKSELGTRSLDHSSRGDPGDQLPKSTPAMLKLVKRANP